MLLTNLRLLTGTPFLKVSVLPRWCILMLQMKVQKSDPGSSFRLRSTSLRGFRKVALHSGLSFPMEKADSCACCNDAGYNHCEAPA